MGTRRRFCTIPISTRVSIPFGCCAIIWITSCSNWRFLYTTLVVWLSPNSKSLLQNGILIGLREKEPLPEIWGGVEGTESCRTLEDLIVEFIPGILLGNHTPVSLTNDGSCMPAHRVANRLRRPSQLYLPLKSPICSASSHSVFTETGRCTDYEIIEMELCPPRRASAE